ELALAALDESVEVADVDLHSAGEAHRWQRAGPDEAADGVNGGAEHGGGLAESDQPARVRRGRAPLPAAPRALWGGRPAGHQKPPTSISPPETAALARYAAAPLEAS